jgi:hypothetical protein
MNFGDLLPDNIRSFVNKVLDLSSALLQGEPALVIGNGAAVVIYLVAKVMGAVPDQTFEQAVASATAAIVTINAVLLTIRKYVYSPASVAKIVLTPPTSAGPVNAAIDAGVGGAINNALDKQEPSA